MSGVSIDPAVTADPDLSLIFKGGSNFLARVQALADAKDAADEALTKLNLGKDVQAAHDEAKALKDAAAKAHADASTTLESAKAQALVITGDAKDDAAALLADAKAKADQAAKDAKAVRDAADAYATEKRNAADVDLKKAIAQSNAADQSVRDAAALHVAAKAAHDEAVQSKAKADALAADLKARIAKVTSALSEATKG